MKLHALHRGRALAAAFGLSLLCRVAGAATDDTTPQLLQRAPLVYPPDGGGAAARVRLEIQIDAGGRVTEARVVATEPVAAPPGFAAAALAHARALRFSPTSRAGEPMASVLQLALRFTPPVPAAPLATQAPTAPPLAAAAPTAPPPATPAAAEGAAMTARVRGARLQAERATSDFNLEIGQLRVVPRKTAAELLTLAPGILLTSHGGEGHAEQVFLRGFDARLGQDLEFTVAGLPINEVANAHGQGYADSHFIIPETVDSLRVIEGPFDPRQGDFAVAGSAEYRLAVPERGLRASYRGGSFNTHRLLLLWAPGAALGHGLGRDGTFGAVELAQSDGFGQNRFYQRAAATAQYEIPIGEAGSVRLLLMTYATRFKSPGVVRQDDYESGRMDFFGSYDLQQGGEVQRHSLSVDAGGKVGAFQLRQLGFLILRQQRLRENFTGFLYDPQLPGQTDRGLDPQRGDLIDQNTGELTVGARGSLAVTRRLLGLPQRLELGYYARHDRNDATQLRLRDGTVIPYRTDFDFGSGQSNLAAYADLDLRPLRWLTLRGGVRGDFFLYDVLNRCDRPGGSAAFTRAPLDIECYDVDRYGHRNKAARRGATGILVQPRVTLQLEPLRGLFLTGSYGHGARSVDALFLGDGDDAPFATIRAAEGGALLHRLVGPVDLTARAAFYHTHVDRDLIFNETIGRNTLANGTTRLGVVAAVRATAPFLDASVHLTWARATFDEDGLLVPYVPPIVLRADVAAFGDLPRARLAGRAIFVSGGLGFTYVAPRPLPLSERGDAYYLFDLSARARWDFLEVGVMVENVLDQRYRLSEFNYSSDFRSRPFQTLLPARHFIAGPPLSALATLTLHLDALFGAGKKP